MGKTFQTPEERAVALEQARRVADHGLPPQGPVTRAPSAVAPPDPDCYTAEDLFASALCARRKRMPNGKWLWVHPLSLEQVVWVNGQATRHLLKLRLQENDPGRPVAYRTLVWVYQVIACCRVGPEPNSAPVFTEAHAEALFRNPDPGSECIQEIVNLCDELGRAGGGQGLTPELEAFFGAIASWLATCALRLTPETLESWREGLEAFARYASSITLQKTFSASDLNGLPPLPAEVSARADTEPPA